jgi:hypothetical protein
VVFTGQVNTTVGGAVTVNVAEQVVVNGAQVLVYVNNTVVEPPQADGAPWLLLTKTPLQPPLADAVASQALNAAFTWSWVKQASTVCGDGQFNTTVGGAGTVKVAVQLVGVWHALFTVKVTVLLPPQADGAPMLLFVKTPLQPPVKVAELSHAK